MRLQIRSGEAKLCVGMACHMPPQFAIVPPRSIGLRKRPATLPGASRLFALVGPRLPKAPVVHTRKECSSSGHRTTVLAQTDAITFGPCQSISLPRGRLMSSRHRLFAKLSVEARAPSRARLSPARQDRDPPFKTGRTINFPAFHVVIGADGLQGGMLSLAPTACSSGRADQRLG
jgi:hypothetical protein